MSFSRTAWFAITSVPVGYVTWNNIFSFGRIHNATSSGCTQSPVSVYSQNCAKNENNDDRSKQSTSTSLTIDDGGNDIILWRNQYTFSIKQPIPGDIVCLRSPWHAGESQVLRLIGRADDMVETRTNTVEHIGSARIWVETDSPDGECEDSALTTKHDGFGQIPEALLRGVAVAVVWPPSRWGIIPRKEIPSIFSDEDNVSYRIDSLFISPSQREWLSRVVLPTRVQSNDSAPSK